VNIGLVDVDSHNFPNLALMKISAYHKRRGEELRPDYVVERIKKYDEDYNELCKKYRNIAEKRKESCPIRWCFKVEVHC
jgi:hypothetical protein